MNRALLIAPQWMGDAVMSQPLVGRLAARGDEVTVAALPWVAPVYRAMAGVREVIELPFAHGRLDWAARRRVAASLRGRFDVARTGEARCAYCGTVYKLKAGEHFGGSH